jgi:hypothetical protein
MITALVVVLIWVILVMIPTAITFNKGLRFGKNVVVRCSAGHLYTTIWIPSVSLKAFRWGFRRYQYCPVGKHWAWISQLRGFELTSKAIEDANKTHDIRIF